MGLLELQKISDRDVSYLFSRYQPINSKTANPHGYLLNQYGYLPGRSSLVGLDFDIYSKQYVYNNRGMCGAGLGEVFNLLQSLFNGSQK